MTRQSPEGDKTQTYTILAPGVEVGVYRLVQKIGWGGMGEVYSCDDTVNNRRVALKFLRADYAADSGARTRFEREADAAAALDHPNIVRVHDTGEFTGRPYFVMQYVEGRSLRQVIDTETVSLDRAINILLQICDGLEAAHREGIVHRDLKPANVLVDTDDHATILDFGLARVLSDLHITEHGTAVGTANYMSPEQAEGKEIDQRADLFALGILFYELLTGVNPFARGYAPATLYAIAHDQPRPLRDILPSLPGSCQTTINRALAKRAEDRYPDVASFAADLRRIQQRETVTSVESHRKRPNPAGQPSLAVLYLRNLGDTADDYLSYGITEDLIIDLSRIGTIRIAPMRRILPFKDSTSPLDDIARQLGVNLILDGSIHHDGDKIRVSAQLLDMVADETVWSNRWEELASELPRIKDSLARHLLDALQISSRAQTAAGIGQSESSSPEAYEYYLRGKYAFEYKKERADVDAAIEWFERALDLEPSLLAARIGRALVYSFLTEVPRAIDELKEVLTEARERNLVADQIRALNELGTANCLIAQYETARKYLEEAVSLAVKHNNLEAEVAARSALLLADKVQGQTEHSEKRFAKIMELCSTLDDQSHATMALMNMGWISINTGRADRARKYLENGLTIARKARNRAREAGITTAIAATYFGRAGKYAVRTERSYYRKALKIWEELQDNRNLVGSTNNMGLVLRRSGEFQKAYEHFAAANERVEDLGDQGYHSMVSSNLAETLYCLDRVDDGLASAQAAEQFAMESKQKAWLSYALIMKGLGKFLADQSTQAERSLVDAAALADKGNFAWQRTLAYLHLGIVQWRGGRPDDARESLILARDIAAGPAQFEEPELQAAMHLAVMDAGGDNHEQAATVLRQGIGRVEDTYLEIPFRRLLGEALLARDDTHEEGVSVLQDARKRAETLPYPLEVRLIDDVLQSIDRR